jgi:hypothetical protein
LFDWHKGKGYSEPHRKYKEIEAGEIKGFNDSKSKSNDIRKKSI